MKKTIALIILGLLVCIGSLRVSASTSTSGTNIRPRNSSATDLIGSWMPDKVLQKWVAQKLGININSITQDKMKDITDLQAPPDGLTSLKGLEYAINLKHLAIGYSKVSSLSPISSLTSLDDLQINSTKVTDFSPIYGLTGLKTLNVSNDLVGDTKMASILQAIGSHLGYLQANNARLRNIEYLSHYTNITALEISYNEISDMRPLKDFPILEGDAVGQTFLSSPTVSDSRNITIDDLKIYYKDGTRLQPINISDSGIFDSTTHKISFLNLYALSGQVTWDYYMAPKNALRFGGIAKNNYNLEIPAKIIAEYVDTNGNKISDDVVKSGKVGEAYATEQKAIDGYTFKGVQGSAKGTFTDQPQTVTYVYMKDPVAGGDITAKYVDTSGNKISDDVVKSGKIGEAYATEKKSIDGYTFKGVQGSAKGTFTDQPQTVTYVYMKNNVTPSPQPDNHSDASESIKSNGKKSSASESKSTLPQTGDNEGLSVIRMISGFFLILGATMMILFKRKRKD